MALKNLVEVNVGARNTEWCNSWIWEECNIHLRLTTFWRRGNRPRGPWPHLTSLLKVIHRSSTQDPTSILQVDSSFLFSSPGSERVCVWGGGSVYPQPTQVHICPLCKCILQMESGWTDRSLVPWGILWSHHACSHVFRLMRCWGEDACRRQRGNEGKTGKSTITHRHGEIHFLGLQS